MKTVLLVEDDPDMRLVLEAELEDRYRVLSAANGREGLDLAVQEIPDLILADVMMPVMTGTEMCAGLREHPQTRHIPVILLTACDEEAQQIAGLEAGAVDYITKPFSTRILQLRIQNFLENPPRVPLPPQEADPFMDRLSREVRAHRGDAGFGVEALAEALNTTPRTLQRKLKERTGLTPREWIRRYRMEAARRMLEQENWRVAEVAFKVGYEEVSHFSRSFKQIFGFPPSQVRKSTEDSSGEG